MPRPRALITYPNDQFRRLAERGREGNCLVPCTKSQALSIRGEWYAWRRVCELNPEIAKNFGIDAEILRDVALRVDAGGLMAFPAILRESIQVLERALGPADTIQQKAGESLAMLREALAQGEREES